MGLWSPSVVLGKARYLACGLVVSCLRFVVCFLEVAACTKISLRFCGLPNASIRCFLCRNVMLWLLPKKSQLEDIILSTILSRG